MSEKLTDADVEAINQALLDGQKIAAIKIYREATGRDLKDAKDFVELLESKLREQYPDRFEDNPKKGCAAVIVIGLFAVILWQGLNT